MCRRLTLAAPAAQVARVFGLADVPPLAPRYNVAPCQPVAVVGLKADNRTRGLSMLRWGLVPRGTGGRPRFEARAETVARLPALRESFARRRCLVPADGFFVWQVAGLAEVPHHVRRADGGVMGLAALWAAWTDPAGRRVAACCLLTTAAAGSIRHLHDRTPAILPEHEWTAWLSLATPVGELRQLLRPYPSEQLAAVVVGPAVNDPATDGPECVRPAGRGTWTPGPGNSPIFLLADMSSVDRPSRSEAPADSCPPTARRASWCPG